MDDFNASQAWPAGADEVNRLLLDLFDRYGVRITMFTVGRNVEDDAGAKRLEAWVERGHRIGNHTYSHFTINSPGHSLEEFEADMLRAERILSAFKTYERMFRFPALKEGDTIAARDGMRAFLKAHGYRNGAVTIDASDWYYNRRLASRLRKDPGFSADRFREPYVRHIRDRSLYYDGVAREVLGRSPKHTLLVHFSYLNACYLQNVLEMYRSLGWKLVSPEEAFADPLFQLQPQTLPAGESLIWALAKQSGRYEGRLRYPGEDGVYEREKLDRLGL